MKKKLLTIVAAIVTALTASAGVTLEQCLEAARENYPLIKKYDLVAATENVELSHINKGWLPKIGVYAQGTIQNVVPSFPSTLSTVMEQMGGEIKGLSKLQYKVGLDLNQTVWDGGASRSRREVARATTDVNHASLDVEMYGIRSRVESLYFGILLLQSQIEKTESALEVYAANLKRINSMVTNGIAMQADADMVEAQMLGLKQQLASAKSTEKGLRDMLSLFTAMDISNENLEKPMADIPDATDASSRPEMKLFAAREALNESRRAGVDVSLMPKIGLFAQSYYGYPGIDYFKAMMTRELSFNIVAGVKVSWNIDSFYTRKNSLNKINIANDQVAAERETFLFNNTLQAASQREDIQGIEAVMADDARIVELRRNVRTAAESQLRNGIIDATALTTKINDETQAEIAASYHAIQHLQAIYNLKNTLNK